MAHSRNPQDRTDSWKALIMAVDDDARARMRAAGKASALTKAKVAEPGSYENGREDMRDCVANSTRWLTRNAVLECRLNLQK